MVSSTADAIPAGSDCAYAAAIAKHGGEVETIRGCMISKEPIDRVVKQICDGTLDEPLKHPRFK